MTTLWVAILGVALASAAIKAIGPVLVGGKDLPPGATAVIALLAPALLTALVVTETFGVDGHLVLDERAAGVGVAGPGARPQGAGASRRRPRGADDRAGKGLRLGGRITR